MDAHKIPTLGWLAFGKFKGNVVALYAEGALHIYKRGTFV